MKEAINVFQLKGWELKLKKKIDKNKSTQFPLMLPCLCLVNKEQFKEAVPSFDLFKQLDYNNGQIYVA